ncbi:MAG: hypothetical protein M0Z83_00285 [Betaproteobacteria bacterium]|nr:hypothetical protein [Betaproteobacteria bacterium]
MMHRIAVFVDAGYFLLKDHENKQRTLRKATRLFAHPILSRQAKPPKTA